MRGTSSILLAGIRAGAAKAALGLLVPKPALVVSAVYQGGSQTDYGVGRMEMVRIIPCLDVKDGRVVKGVNFVNLRDARDPIEAGEAYCRAGADELVFLDIMATVENRKTRLEWVKKVAERVSIPFAVGGVGSLEDMNDLYLMRVRGRA